MSDIVSKANLISKHMDELAKLLPRGQRYVLIIPDDALGGCHIFSNIPCDVVLSDILTATAQVVAAKYKTGAGEITNVH